MERIRKMYRFALARIAAGPKPSSQEKGAEQEKRLAELRRRAEALGIAVDSIRRPE